MFHNSKKLDNLINFYYFINIFYLGITNIQSILKLKNGFGQVWELWPLNMNDFLKIEVGGTMNNPKINYIFNRRNCSGISFDNCCGNAHNIIYRCSQSRKKCYKGDKTKQLV